MRTDKIIPIFDKIKQSPSFFVLKKLDSEDVDDITEFYEILIESQNMSGDKSVKEAFSKLRG